jgi:hypothetical protein
LYERYKLISFKQKNNRNPFRSLALLMGLSFLKLLADNAEVAAVA